MYEVASTSGGAGTWIAGGVAAWGAAASSARALADEHKHNAHSAARNIGRFIGLHLKGEQNAAHCTRSGYSRSGDQRLLHHDQRTFVARCDHHLQSISFLHVWQRTDTHAIEAIAAVVTDVHVGSDQPRELVAIALRALTIGECTSLQVDVLANRCGGRHGRSERFDGRVPR